MFEKNQLVVYGGTGVCRVRDITTPNISIAQRGQLYYVLEPLYQAGTIYTPVDSDKVSMREVISKEEAEHLIDLIPGMRAQAFTSSSVQQLAEHYGQSLQAHDCESLIELVMSIYAKKRSAESQKRRFGQVDASFMKRAEDLLYGEFSVALGIPKDTVGDYIAARVEKHRPQPKA